MSPEQATALLEALRNLAIGIEYLRSIPSNAASARVFAPSIAQWDNWTSGAAVMGDDETARAQAALARLLARLQALPAGEQRMRAAQRLMRFARALQLQIEERQRAVARQRGALAQRVGNLVGSASRHVGQAIQSAGTLGILTSGGIGLAIAVAVVLAFLVFKKG